MFDLKLGEKKVEYLELIYDLIFVYLIGRNSSMVHHVEDGFITGGMYLSYVLYTLIIIQIWMYTTFYINRYGSNGVTDHIGIFINMYLLYYMADATRIDWQSSFYRYNIAWGLILLNMAVQYLIQLRKVPDGQPWESEHIKQNMGLILIQAVIVFALIPVYAVTGLALTPAAMFFGIVGSFAMSRVNQLVMIDFSHLSERAMLYVVFTFGEMIIAIASYFSGGFGLNTVYFSLCAFLIVAGLFLSYGICYDHLIDREMHTNGAVYMLIHIFLIFALNNLTTALEFMHDDEVALVPKSRFLVGSFLLFFVCLLALRRFAKVKMRLNLKFLVIACIVSGVFVLLMAVFYKQMYVNIAISAAFVYVILILLFRFHKIISKIDEGSQTSLTKQ